VKQESNQGRLIPHAFFALAFENDRGEQCDTKRSICYALPQVFFKFQFGFILCNSMAMSLLGTLVAKATNETGNSKKPIVCFLNPL